MSHEFVVWEGAAPLSNVHGASEYERRRSRIVDPGMRREATPKIGQFLSALLDTYPDSGHGGSENSPWLDEPLITQAANGSVARLRVGDRWVGSVRKLIEVEAARFKLVAYEPQTMLLLPSAVTMHRSSEFDLPSLPELALHLQAVIGEALEAQHRMVGVLEERATGYYVQWLAQGGSVLLEAEGDAGLPPGLWTDAPGRSTLHSLGFDEGDPNWECVVEGGLDLLEPIAEAIARVLMVVRNIPVGAKMRVETFPVEA